MLREPPLFSQAGATPTRRNGLACFGPTRVQEQFGTLLRDPSDIPLTRLIAGRDLNGPREITVLTSQAIEAFGNAQIIVVLAPVPLLLAVTIAGEQTRGTRALLPASRLRSLGIIADKLAAWMVLALNPMPLPSACQ
jgi:hypothetical protein